MTAETVLETERLRLTSWLPGQIGDVVRLHSDPEVIRYLNANGEPETRADAERRLAEWQRQFADRRMGKLRVTRLADGAFLGRAGFGIHGPEEEPEIGYALLRKHWGNGYAREAAAGLRDWYFRETDRNSFIGMADTRNTASLGVLLDIGMRRTHQAVNAHGAFCQFHILTREDWLG
jgi:RimJ/RimL family protein N-acetyltransferase